MKQIFIFSIVLNIILGIAVCRRPEPQVVAPAATQQYYVAVEIMLDMIYKDHSEYFLDVLMETDEWFYYMEAFEQIDSLYKTETL